jgi:predicted nucleotidyltransferase
MNTYLADKIKSYFKEKPEVIAVYLFGSYAQGNEARLSDIDIGILLHGSNRDTDFEKRVEYLMELSKILKKDIHPVILNSANEELVRQIFLKGRCLLENDSRELSKYKMVMISRIADFAYHRHQMQSGFVRKVMEG